MTTTASPRTLAAGAAALLDQGHKVDRLSRLITAVALAGLIAIATFGAPKLVVVVPLALAVLAGVVELYFAIRVGFDAALFQRLSDTTEIGTAELADLDAALAAMGLAPADNAGRPLAARVTGACRLFRRQAGSLALQIVLILLGAMAALS